MLLCWHKLRNYNENVINTKSYSLRLILQVLEASNKYKIKKRRERLVKKLWHCNRLVRKEKLILDEFHNGIAPLVLVKASPMHQEEDQSALPSFPTLYLLFLRSELLLKALCVCSLEIWMYIWAYHRSLAFHSALESEHPSLRKVSFYNLLEAKRWNTVSTRIELEQISAGPSPAYLDVKVLTKFWGKRQLIDKK